jgi:hypothetical protein
MFKFKITDSRGYVTHIVAFKQNIQNGDLILVDDTSKVVGAFAKGTWSNCVRVLLIPEIV